MKLILASIILIISVAGRPLRATAYASSPLVPSAFLAVQAHSQPGISGIWIAKLPSPFGELELVYTLRVKDGKISGSQSLPFGDSPIIDGFVEGDTFHFTVELDSFGNLQKREVTGKIVGDTLVLTPAFPGPPPEAGASPFRMKPVTAVRGTPTPSYRPGRANYAELPPVPLPALQQIPASGLASTPPMGWNSWNKFQTHIDDAAVRAIADSMVKSGMRDAGYQYVLIDDGWQGTRSATGILSPNPNFPDMKALADYVHSRGLKIGIYSSPGPRTCGSFEGSYGQEEQDAQTFAAWGMDYLKYDWCSASHIWKDKDMQAVYQRMGAALVKTKRPIVYALCQYGRADVTTWGTFVGANLWRTTSDIRDQYEAMASIGFAQSKLANAAGPGHWNDPDMLEVGNGGMSNDEYQTHFSLWAMIAAPLIAGNDLREMSKETQEILTNKEVIAVDQDALGVGGTSVQEDENVQIWTKPLTSNETAVAIFNRSPQALSKTVSMQSLGLNGAYSIRDLWAHADLGTAETNLSAKIPAHGVAMFRLRNPAP